MSWYVVTGGTSTTQIEAVPAPVFARCATASSLVRAGLGLGR